MLTTSLCILTTNIEYLMSQVERMSFQHGMAELVREPIPRKITTRKLWCVRSSPDSDRQHLSPKKKRSEPLYSFSSIHLPPHNRTSLPSLTYSVTAPRDKTCVQCCVDSSPDFGTQVFIKCFLHWIAKNRWPRSWLCKPSLCSEMVGDWVAFFRKKAFIYIYRKGAILAWKRDNM